METIVALATPPGVAGIGVIRISGDNALNVLKQITNKNDFEPRKMYLTKIDTEVFSDTALSVYFKAPHSFTGEDVAEIQLHSGYEIIQEVINKLISLGCRQATRGEFSKRAFINGKMSLDEAEGIIDFINAETESQAKAASNLANGKLFSFVQETQNDLTDVIAIVEAKLDYPEYEITEFEENEIRSKIALIRTKVEKLLNTSKNGLLIKNGIKVAIVGAPNVGKSSLMNALTNFNKSIVTDIAGTTRDVVEGEYIYNGVVFRLFDTAGIHETDDVVERIGVERAYDAIKNADIVLKLSLPNEKCEVEVENAKVIEVVNKIDLVDNLERKSNIVYISALKGENIEKLKDIIFNLTLDNNENSDSLMLTNERHINAMKECLELIDKAEQNFETFTMDFIASDLRMAWEKLGEITGKTSNEFIIDKIFEKFCLGK